MFFKKLDPDSGASRGDLEALLAGQKEAHFWTEEVVKDAARFVENPFDGSRDSLLTSSWQLIQARLALRKVEESIPSRLQGEEEGDPPFNAFPGPVGERSTPTPAHPTTPEGSGLTEPLTGSEGEG